MMNIPMYCPHTANGIMVSSVKIKVQIIKWKQMPTTDIQQTAGEFHMKKVTTGNLNGFTESIFFCHKHYLNLEQILMDHKTPFLVTCLP